MIAGMVVKSPPSTVRLPLIRVTVRSGPIPRRSICTWPSSLLPLLVVVPSGVPDIEGMRWIRLPTSVMPWAMMSSRSSTVTGLAVSRSARLMREPVTVISSRGAAVLSCASAGTAVTSASEPVPAPRASRTAAPILVLCFIVMSPLYATGFIPNGSKRLPSPAIQLVCGASAPAFQSNVATVQQA